jgi:hypothetical protein
MSLTLVLVALAQVINSPTATNKWLDDYNTGYKQAVAQHKPLAVFVGHGTTGYNAVAQEGQLDQQSQKLLREHYVCVYVDATEEGNRDLVRQLKAGDGTALVLSDPKAEFVAFRHVGTMTKDQLGNTLKSYSQDKKVEGAAPPTPGMAAPAPAPAPGTVVGPYGPTGCGHATYASDCHSGGCRSSGCRSGGCRLFSGRSRGCSSGGCFGGRSHGSCGGGGCFSGGCR